MDNSSMDTTASDINQQQTQTHTEPAVVAQQSQQQQQQQAAERTFRQSELNEIVGRAKHEAVESYKRQQTSYVPAANNGAQSQQRNLAEEDVRRLAGEELSRQREAWEKESLERYQADAAAKIVNAYKDKIASGKDKYQDFEAVTNNVDMRYYPNVVQLLAEHVDNAPDLLYDMAKNRIKLNQIESLCQHNPQDAVYEIRRLSDSIKANEQSSQIRTSNTPLSQQRASNTGVDSGDTLSMDDLKRKYRC